MNGRVARRLRRKAFKDATIKKSTLLIGVGGSHHYEEGCPMDLYKKYKKEYYRGKRSG